VVAGVADERPAGARRGSEECGQRSRAAQRLGDDRVPEQVGERQTRPKLPGVGIDGVAAERVVLAARPLRGGEREAVADREDAEESAWFEPGVHARDRGTAPVCVVGEGYRRVVMVNPRPGQLGNPGVTAVCADHQARAALSRRSRYSGDSVARTDGLGIDTDVPSQSSSASR
jgi:hypothetical protein